MSDVIVVNTVSHVREVVSGWRASGRTVALVPTMGNLHRGHASLIELGAASADTVVVSVFVNPTQFGPGEDYAAYPRTLEADRALIAGTNCAQALFAPGVDDIYPFGVESAVRIVMPPLSRELCGAARPGHFDGVASVVCRLLNIVAPDVIVLGRKDYQQMLLIERMIADLRLPVSVVAGETQRETDGLAISSRNVYLTAAERRRAPLLRATLGRVSEALRDGARDYAALEAGAVQELAAAGFRPDYVEVRQAADLAKPNGRHAPNDLIVVAAAWLGRARLIDNVRV